MTFTYTLIFILLVSILLIDNVASKTNGEKLADLVNGYRRQKGLSTIPYSKALMKVAKLHVENSCQVTSLSNRDCWNPHSWDKIPGTRQDYKTCCYDPWKGNTGKCIWDKPREIAGFDENGFEISSGGGSSLNDFLDGWKESSSHDDTITQSNSWKYYKWKSIGCAAVIGQVAHCWFASKSDSSYRSQGEPTCGSGSTYGGSGSSGGTYGGSGSSGGTYGGSGSSGSSGSCVTLNVYGSSSSLAGNYQQSGSSGGKAAYSGPNRNWLYTYPYGSKSYWVISKNKGSKSWSNGYCSESDVVDCNGKWRVGGGYNDDMEWTNCGSNRYEMGESETLTEAHNANNKGSARIGPIVGGFVVAVMICVVLLCLYMKKKRRQTQGVKVHETDINLDDEEEELDDGIVIKFVDEDEVEMDGEAITKTVR
eukprot:344268_1